VRAPTHTYAFPKSSGLFSYLTTTSQKLSTRLVVQLSTSKRLFVCELYQVMDSEDLTLTLHYPNKHLFARTGVRVRENK